MLKNRTFYEDGVFIEEEFERKLAYLKENAIKRLRSREGELACTLTNPYLFRALMQQKPRVLKEFIRVLLEAPASIPVSCMIQNPLALGLPSFEKDMSLVLGIRIPGYWEGKAKIGFQTEKAGNKLILQAVLRTRQERGEKKHGYECTQIQRMELQTLALINSDSSLNRSSFARLFTVSTWEELKILCSEAPVFLDAAFSLSELCARRDILLQCLDCEYMLLEQCYEHLNENSDKKDSDEQKQQRVQALLAFQRKLLHKQEMWMQKTKAVH